MERLIGIDELQPGEQKSVFVDDVPALVARVGDDYYCIEDTCSHDGQPLEGGAIVDGAIACPRHGARFDLRTGKALCMPATKAILAFNVTLKDDAVWASEEAAVEETVSVPVASVANASTPAAPTASGNVDSVESNSADEAGGEPSGPSTESDYLEALRQVIDPELMINIVDLGLIYSIEQDAEDDGRVNVDMTLTSPACPAGPQLVQQSKMALERLHDVNKAVITMVMVPPWSPERMTDDARDQLGIF